MLLAQWVLNVLQFLTLIAVIWYTWETRQHSVWTARQHELEWRPQYHFSVSGLDPTTGTGEIRGNHTHPLELTANLINLGHSPIVTRGFVLSPEGAVSILASHDPIPVQTGQAQRFPIPTQPILASLLVCNKIPREPESQNWAGKITVELWFEAHGEAFKAKEQFLRLEFRRSELISAKQITRVEFEHLERVPPVG